MSDEKDITKAVVDAVLAQAPAARPRSEAGSPYILGYKAEVDVAVSTTTRIIHDMTPAAAHAQIETAKQTHAVPAQESTKQETERTNQEKEVTKRGAQLVWQNLTVASVVVVCAVLAALFKDSQAALATMASVMGGVYVAVRYLNNRQSTTPALPSKEESGKLPPKKE